MTLRIELRTGFHPIDLAVPPAASGTQRFNFTDVAGRLRPIWPYQRLSPFDAFAERGEAPRFLAKNVEYFGINSERCPLPTEVQRQGGPSSMPTLKEAGCRGVPSRARITLVKDSRAPASPPPKAFVESYPDDYDIRSIA